MWPFRKKQASATENISFSQVDTTERFDDDQGLGPDDWIATIPLNTLVHDPQSMGLPPLGASHEEVYRVASGLSSVRETVVLPDDGVYCPICHIASVDLGKLRTPCPKCERELLKFGWE